MIDKLPAVLTDYYGGPHQALALVDAIFGVTNPGGKLPFTMSRHVGQVPIHYAQKRAAATGGYTAVVALGIGGSIGALGPLQWGAVVLHGAQAIWCAWVVAGRRK